MDNLRMQMTGSRRGARVTALGLPVALALIVVLALPALASAQCAMCGTVGQGKNDPLVKGMFASILFMVSMPFAVVGTLGGWLWSQHRRDEQALHEQENGDRS